MSADGDTVLEKTKAIVLEALAPYSATVYLFGSFARGEAREFSDIDIAVDSREPLPPGALSRLREALEESTIPRIVEVVDLRDASPGFRERVRREGILWSASDND